MMAYSQRANSETRDLVRRISDTTLRREIPNPDDLAVVLHPEAVKAYYFMDALFRFIEYGRGGVIRDRVREDGKPPQRHSFDSAFKQDYRLGDNVLPSRIILMPDDKTDAILHEVEEEFGKTPLGALVANDSIRYLFGDERGTNANLLTNYNGLVYGSLEKKILGLQTINPNGILQLLEYERDRVVIKPRSVNRQYGRITTALRYFRDFVQGNVDYMSPQQKDIVIGIVIGLLEGLERQRRTREILTPDEIRSSVVSQFDNVMGIVDAGDFVGIPKGLLLDGESELLISLKMILHRDYVDRIATRVFDNALRASQNGGVENDSYLAPWMAKGGDTGDNVTNMTKTALPRARNIFMKAQSYTNGGLYLARGLKQLEVPYQRLVDATDYVYRCLEAVINSYLRHLKEDVKLETSLHQDLGVYTAMQQNIGNLRRKVSVMRGQFSNEPRGIKGAIRRGLGFSRGLQIGGYHIL